MSRIKVKRYTNEETKKYWQGFIQPEDLSWIIFIKHDGTPVVYLNRDPVTGAVL